MAVVLLLIGTNLKASRAVRGARFKKHVVEFSEDSGRAENRCDCEKDIGKNAKKPNALNSRLVPERSRLSSAAGFEAEDEPTSV